MAQEKSKSAELKNTATKRQEYLPKKGGIQIKLKSWYIKFGFLKKLSSGKITKFSAIHLV